MERQEKRKDGIRASSSSLHPSSKNQLMFALWTINVTADSRLVADKGGTVQGGGNATSDSGQAMNEQQLMEQECPHLYLCEHICMYAYGHVCACECIVCVHVCMCMHASIYVPVCIL